MDLGNPKNTIEVIQKYNFAFQKKFGQNFLIDTHVLDKIISAAGMTKEDTVLEVGPGIGTMTQRLSQAAGQVIAVEIDTNLIPILKDTLQDCENVTVINEDILKIDIKKLAEEKGGGRPVKVVANLPYYITTPIIMGLFERRADRQHYGYGAERGRRPDAGWSGLEGLRRAVAGGSVLCRAVHRGKCAAELLHSASECRLSGHPPDPPCEAAGGGKG